MISVGTQNPITLPIVPENTFPATVQLGSADLIALQIGSLPRRMYKSIPIEEVKNGDQIRIYKTAGKIGVGLNFHRAFVIQILAKRYVCIELDDAGPKLPDHPDRQRIFGHTEEFCFQLFSQIKVLAENRIGLAGIKEKNIIPVPNSIKFLDCGSAQLMTTTQEALKQSFQSPYIVFSFFRYQTIPDLSAQSQELLQWLNST